MGLIGGMGRGWGGQTGRQGDCVHSAVFLLQKDQVKNLFVLCSDA